MGINTTIKLPTYSCKIIISVVDSVTIEADRIYKKHKVYFQPICIKSPYNPHKDPDMLQAKIKAYENIIKQKI